jgi:hypothetical protein
MSKRPSSCDVYAKDVLYYTELILCNEARIALLLSTLIPALQLAIPTKESIYLMSTDRQAPCTALRSADSRTSVIPWATLLTDAKTHSTPCIMSDYWKRVFVTVGSTKFPELVEAVLSPGILDSLCELGFVELCVQYGKDEELFRKAHQTQAKIALRGFDYSPSIEGEMKQADLIISHAGNDYYVFIDLRFWISFGSVAFRKVRYCCSELITYG